MNELRKITITHRTPTGVVKDEHEILARSTDPNDNERELPLDPQVAIRVSDGGEHIVEFQASDIVAIDFD